MGEAEIGEQVLRAIRRIVRRIAEHSRSLARDHGLTVPQLLCLRAVDELGREGGEITIARVSGRVQLSAATVSRIVERLVRAELVLRERGRQDRRRVSLSLTEAGRERLAELPTPLQEQFVRRLHQLSPTEQATLLGQLELVVEMMEASEVDAAPVLTPEGEVKGE